MFGLNCTATGNSGRSLRQDYGIISIYLKGVSHGETKTKKLHPEFKAESVLEDLSGENSHTEVCRRDNLSDEQLSKWKQQLLENAVSLFEPATKQSDAAAERIVQLEQLVERLPLALDIQKKPQLT